MLCTHHKYLSPVSCCSFFFKRAGLPVSRPENYNLENGKEPLMLERKAPKSSCSGESETVKRERSSVLKKDY